MSDITIDQQKFASTCIEDQHLPSLYQSANAASRSAQRRYFRLQRFHIALLLLGSLGAPLATFVPDKATVWFFLSGMVLTIDVILIWASRERRADQEWFHCRAIAESAKTAAWRFMMKAEPFESDSTAESSFVEKIRQIRTASQSSSENLAASFSTTAPPISDFMRDARLKSVGEKLDLYIKSRLCDQKTWYSEKANFNSKKEICWRCVVLILQILAIGFAFYRVGFSSSLSIIVVPFLIICAASAIAWSHMKRYGDLARTYSVAAQELGEQEMLASNITEEASFVTFVDQVEGTISREHTMWCVRRDATINPTDKED